MRQIDEREQIIWQWIHAIPCSKVATYGQIAHLAGLPGRARLVGRVLSMLPSGSKLPWYRVVNAQGRISHPDADKQRELLEKEGIHLINGKINLEQFQWVP